MGRLSRIGSAVANTLFPPVCPACRAETGAPDSLCPACWANTEFIAGPVCDGCGRPAPGLPETEPGFRCDGCLRHPPAWDRGRGVLLYGGTGRRMILSLKHGDRLDTVPMLGLWLARAGRELIARADLACPVPLHWTRRVRRRFNQSAELARAALGRAGRPDIHAPDLLRRARRTPSQDGRNREQRAANVEGAIRIAPGAAARVAGRRVLVIDDVSTTGATLSAAARALTAAGASGVDALVVALVKPADAHYFSPDPVPGATEEGAA